MSGEYEPGMFEARKALPGGFKDIASSLDSLGTYKRVTENNRYAALEMTGYRVRGAGGADWIAVADVIKRMGTPDGVCEANARLIAAAPELLSLVKEALREQPAVDAHDRRIGNFNARLEAAIAKVEGR